ncbi:hypothetical protein EYR36_002018 [Pleurotus pulmonarius]|nr:hypothetical protein EYR36_002018 [Pleurotus pulmonarius]
MPTSTPKIDLNALRRRLDLTRRIARESLVSARQDIDIATLKDKQDRARMLRGLKNQLTELSTHRGRAPRDLPTRPRRNRTTPALPSVKSATIYAGGAAQPHPLSSPLSPNLSRPRRNHTKTAPPSAKSCTTYTGRASQLHASPLPARSTTPPTPSTPSTPEFDLARLELDLPSPIPDSDSFWDLNSIATDTDWDDESTAATDTAPLKHALKHECLTISRSSTIESAEMAPVQVNLDIPPPVTTVTSATPFFPDNTSEPFTFVDDADYGIHQALFLALYLFTVELD